jgi:hypothetical protein
MEPVLLWAPWLGLVSEAGMILVFTLLILCVCALIAIPLVLDSDLRQNMAFWGAVVSAALAAHYLIMETIK